MKYKIKIYALALIASGLAASCDSYKDVDGTRSYEEVEKNLAGVWQLSEITRNGVEITNQMDCGQFKLHLEENGRYTLENRLPFPVSEDGVWKIDDPRHPFMISFKEDDVLGDPVEIEIQYPIVNGKRQLSITHSPGCESNNYIYVFVESN